MSYDPTAPGFEPEAVGLPWYRRALAQGFGYMAPSTIFLAIPLWFAAAEPATLPATVVCILVVAALYLGSSLAVELGHRARWLWLGALVATLLLVCLLSGTLAALGYYASFVCAVAVLLLPWEESRVVVGVAGVAGILAGFASGDVFAALLGGFGMLLGYSVGLGMLNGKTRRALRTEQARTTVLAVAAERERIARDLHDILGHSLTTIAVKADLARRLVERDPARAASEMAEVGHVARQALADVRATTAGMREVRLATEIASARAVLAAAGITASASSAVEATDDAASEVLGYVVREAVTNVVRHAGASTCTIEADGRGVRIVDDGHGFSGRPGNGLAGLTRRVGEAGGELTVESSASGTVVTAILPAGHPEEGS